VPSFIELYGNGTSLVLGNTDLIPERGTNADLGLWIDHDGERLRVISRTTAFGARVDDLIQWQYSSWGQARADNLGRARIVGLEQELRIAFGRWAQAIAQATYLDARDESDNAATHGKQIPYHPRFRAYARPELRVSLSAALELRAYADADARLHSYTDGANLLDHQRRLVVGCGVSLAWVPTRLRVIASAANLTDTRQEDVDSWALPGRAVFVALAYAPIGADGENGPRYGQ